MDLEKMYLEEDQFPRQFASCETRSYGVLFYNEENKDSFDSNHAVLYRAQITDLDAVLCEVVAFYRGKGIPPTLYQSIREEGYFDENRDTLAAHGFACWTEPQSFMVLSGENTIRPNPQITVQKAETWDAAYGTEIFEKAGEPWEIGVVKRALEHPDTLFFVARRQGRPVGMLHAHHTDGVCRVNYLLVAPEHRNVGAGRALIGRFVEYCRANRIRNCYLWPDGETAERIYYEAGFRTLETKQAGRAAYRAD